MSPFTNAGTWIMQAAITLLLYTWLLTQVVCLVVLCLIVARYVTDRFNVNPFGRLVFYLRRPTDRWYHYVKHSSMYYAFKKALQFEPVWLMMVLGLLLCYLLLPGAISLVAGFMQAVGTTLLNFGEGRVSAGVSALIGTVLLAVIYYLMLQMTVLVIHFFFGILQRQAERAGRLIYPLINLALDRFDRSGRFFPLFFLLLSFLLQFAASLIGRTFF